MLIGAVQQTALTMQAFSLNISPMQSALAKSAPPALGSLIEGGSAALFLDFDGTLVELAETPDAIAPIAGLTDHLAQLARRLEGRCAIVSGRAIEDIEKHMGQLRLAIAGSHGSDIRSAYGEQLGTVAEQLPVEIEAALRGFAHNYGVDFEYKAHGGALHYRRNPEQGEAARAFAREVASKHGWKAQEGKCVIELVAGSGDKGTAVQTIMASVPFEGATPFFIGDDLTDEAGFAACAALGGAGILVGEREDTCAQFRLPDVVSVHNWLEI